MKNPNPSTSTKFFVVAAESGVNQFRQCCLGKASTKRDAIEDAYGPGGRLSRSAIIREYGSRDEAANDFGDAVYY